MIQGSRLILLLSAALLPFSLHAETETAAYAQTDPVEEAPGALTRLWQSMQPAEDTRPLAGDDAEAYMVLQRQGDQASANIQPVTAALREKAAARFLKTFDNPIPESVYGNDFKSGQ